MILITALIVLKKFLKKCKKQKKKGKRSTLKSPQILYQSYWREPKFYKFFSNFGLLDFNGGAISLLIAGKIIFKSNQ